ncbi:uncharacterized protein SETTUDRAFT_95231 [Exserohilum turcica Et28A]|uniref:Arrestin-like N-terminal domain-containing protein n=1 Tax=Exserohilum turcicum (strain 28A) TaxID=671987 RepID=R0K5L9_EXST2|nr:uncharacterized protein SETTUDRAFT_95231 [Exserohilum turcica Et28A]EOA83612.1 hypothetical protein SETTUDRAFT_95231 [Exserohilum turcica Et28A]
MLPEGPFAGRRANRRDNPIYMHLAGAQSSYTVGDHVRGVLLVAPVRCARIDMALRAFSVAPNYAGKAVPIEFYRESQTLFDSETGDELDLLPKSTANPGKTEIPFSFAFAQYANLPPPPERDWFWTDDSYNHPRFQHSPGFPLPPSFSAPVSAEIHIVYQLEVTMDHLTPGTLPVRIRQELKYVPPPPDFQPALLLPDLNFGIKLPKHCSHQKFIRTRKLYEDYDERAGKLMKIKDKLADKELLFGFQSLAEIPYVKFSLYATPARVLVIGCQVPAIITLKHLQRSESLVNPPDVFIRRVKVQLNAAFNMLTPGDPTGRHCKKQVVSTERGQILLLDKKYEKGNGEPLHDGLALLDIADVKLTDHDFIPSFTSYGLNLEYELQIEITGKCADREWNSIVCTQPVQLVTASQAPIPLVVGDGDIPYGLELRPMYHEVDPLAQLDSLGVSREAQQLRDSALAYELHARHMAPTTADNLPPPEYTA